MIHHICNLDGDLQKAWDFAWVYYCTGKDARQQWLTATDVKCRMRAAAAELIDCVPYGSKGMNDYASQKFCISTGIPGFTLLDAVRDFLRRQVSNGDLVAHNFGRGHISGMRYRPSGVLLTNAEKNTVGTKNRRRNGGMPVHFIDPEKKHWPSRTLCSRKARDKKKGMSFRRPTQSSAHMTVKQDKVTCKRCLKLLTQEPTDANT